MAVDTETTTTTMPVIDSDVTNHQDHATSHITTDMNEKPDPTSPASEEKEASDGSEDKPTKTKKSFGFYAIILALALTSLLTSLEATITSTALPTITSDLGGASLYVWVVNGYYLTQ